MPLQPFPESFLQQIRERVSIVDLFPPASLQKRGREFLSLCPWHQDHNASLTVSPRTNRVHCFVCNRGSDVIGWLQEQQGLSFPEAVQELADRYGIPLPARDRAAAARSEQEQRERQRLRRWRQQQLQDFQRSLQQDLACHGPAATYLQARGIRRDTAIAWGLGLNARRLMLPIRDSQGHCCGFSGRSLEGQQPKYRNSAADLLFQKAQLLYGLDQAKGRIRRSGEALLVEGPIDVLQLHQAGLDHAVAALGTAICSEQLQRLQRAGARRLWVAYDGDQAGEQATARLITTARPLLLRADLDLLVVPLPAGEDPDSLLRSQGAEGINACLKQGRHWLQWELDRLLADVTANPDDLSALQRCERLGSELLSQLPAGALRHRAEQRLQQALGAIGMAAEPVGGAGNGMKAAMTIAAPAHAGAPGRPQPRQLQRHQGAAGSLGKVQGPPQGQGSSANHRGGQPQSRGHAQPQHHRPQPQQRQCHGETEAMAERQRQAERRALRLFLCSPASRDVLAVLELSDPLHREAMGCLWRLHQRLSAAASNTPQSDGLHAALIAALPALDPPLAQLLTPLLHCGEPVRRQLAAHPQLELQWILDLLEPLNALGSSTGRGMG